MCLGYGDSKFLTDVKVTNELDGAGEGYDLINVNLNDNTDGTDLYLYTSNTRTEVNPLNTAFYYHKEKKLYFLGGPDGKYFYTYIPKDGKVTDAELIMNKFGKLPSKLDAAFVWNYDEKTYFFKGKYVYRYNYKTMTLEDGYPKTIAREFKGIPNNIDAVFSWDKDNNTYFFKDKFLFKFDSEKKRVANGYPRLIKARFPGAPDKVDAVYYNVNDNETYFIRANDYFILDSSEKVKSGYPKKLNLKYPGLGLLPRVNTFFTALGIDQKMYFFDNKDMYFKYESDNLSEGILINNLDESEFPRIPLKFDCALDTEENSVIMFFKDDKVFSYNRIAEKLESEETISDKFGIELSNIDAAVLYQSENYLFKSDKVYKFTPGEPGVKEGYPKKIKDEFTNMPDNIDAFTKYKDKFYIIKGIQYYVLDSGEKKIKLGRGPNKYPKYLDTEFKNLKTAADRTNVIDNAASTTPSSS